MSFLIIVILSILVLGILINVFLGVAQTILGLLAAAFWALVWVLLQGVILAAKLYDKLFYREQTSSKESAP